MSTKYKLQSVRVQSESDGTWGASFDSMISEISIVESIDFPGIRATLVVNDSISSYTKFKGDEILELVFNLPDLEQSKGYLFKVYRIGPIIKLEKKARYTIECISQEAMLNELSYVFGSYKDKKVSEIVREILTDPRKGIDISNNGKQLNIEETRDRFQCVIPGMRVYDAINWMGGKAIRRQNQGGTPQSGFIFYENYDGFHFKSFDKIIEDALNFSEYRDRDENLIRHPVYRYYPKKSSNESVDVGVIESVSYPDVFNTSVAIRNGSFAGLYTTIALDVIPNSKYPTPQNDQKPYQGTGFRISDLYGNQSHLGTINPYESSTNLPMYSRARRNRMRTNMIHAWDSTNQENLRLDTGAVPQRTEETAVYTHCRKATFEAIKLNIKVAGNASLHVGNPLTVEIPVQISDDRSIQMDEIYSGLYIIAGVRHHFAGDVLSTELVLVKDSLGSSTPSS